MRNYILIHKKEREKMKKNIAILTVIILSIIPLIFSTTIPYLALRRLSTDRTLNSEFLRGIFSFTSLGDLLFVS